MAKGVGTPPIALNRSFILGLETALFNKVVPVLSLLVSVAYISGVWLRLRPPSNLKKLYIVMKTSKN